MKISFLIFLLILCSLHNAIYCQIQGCTDPLAINYNKTATANDGSCIYDPAEVSPLSASNLSPALKETSGLLWWNDYLWTHNDNSDISIYKLDTVNGSIISSFPLTGIVNNDWEEISEDDTHLYIGDFGNNGTGNRTDLRILKIEKNSFLAGTPSIEAINFSYSNQTDSDPSGVNNTDFDCEALIIYGDSIYLFTKQWISNETSLYSLPKLPGTYKAKLKATHDVDGLITGAVCLASRNLVVLSGYSTTWVPFVYLLYDFTGSDFFNGNKRKIIIDCPYHQVEGISTTNGLKYYISNEYVSIGSLLTIPNKLQILDLSTWLKKYFSTITGTPEDSVDSGYIPYPIPAGDYISVKCNDSLRFSPYSLIDMTGHTVKSGLLPDEIPGIYVAGLPAGIYILIIGEKKADRYKIVKR
jgi:hypothetical protein